MSEQIQGQLIFYQTEDGRSRIECHFAGDSLWLSLKQMADLFGRDKSLISKHLESIFEDGEFERNSVVANHATTAAELIHQRADAGQPHMGLTHPAGKEPRKSEVSVAKNYLNEKELNMLNRIVTAYLEFAELQVESGRLMTMADWIIKLDDFLKLGDHDLLTHAGKISAEQAKEKAHLEYDRYRKVIDLETTRVDKDLEAAIKKLSKKGCRN